MSKPKINEVTRELNTMAKEALTNVKQQQQQKGYHHKCCVCGKTDTDFPEMQFRYCSKCAGYHCYCQDHIFNHVHFTE